MSYVASQAEAHALKPPPSQAPRPHPAADRAPQPFESLLDDGAQAAAPPANAPPANAPTAKSEAAGKRGNEPKAADGAQQVKPGQPDKPAAREATADSDATDDSATGANATNDANDAIAQSGADDKRISIVGKPGDTIEAGNGKIKSADKKTDPGAKINDEPAADAATLTPNAVVQPQADKPVAIAAPVAAPAQSGDAAPPPEKVTAPADAIKAAPAARSGAPAPADDDGLPAAPTPAPASNDSAQTAPAPQQTDARDAPKDKPLSSAPQIVTAGQAGAKKTDAGTKTTSKDARVRAAAEDAPAQAVKNTPAEQADAKPQTASAKATDKEADAHARGDIPANPHRAAPAAEAQPAAANTAATSVPKPGAEASQTLALNAPSHATGTASAAAVPAPNAVPAAPQPAVPLAGLAIAIAARALPGKNRFEIRLDPPELGRIEVRLDVDRDGHVTSHLIADRQDTLTLLQRDASGLQRTLQDAGLKTSDNGLQFSLRDQSGGTQQTASPSAAARLIVEDDALVTAPQNNYAQLARLRGGLDIRV